MSQSQSSFSDSNSGCCSQYSIFSPSTSEQTNSPAMSAHQDGEPYLEIIEQPDKYHFRFDTELDGKHGILLGERKLSTRKTFPTARLHNFMGEALIRCSLYQVETPMFHPHTLYLRSKELTDPNGVTSKVPMNGNYTAIFEGMGIVAIKKPDLEKELLRKLIADGEFNHNRNLTFFEIKVLKSKANSNIGSVDINQARLCFDAYQSIAGKWTPICQSVFSTPIGNKKSAKHNDLKIVEQSLHEGSASGDDDMILLVNKVQKNNIQVIFFERETQWKAEGTFEPANVHHQFAIKLKTPPYRDANITDKVQVFIQLYRPSDEEFSEPVEFCYKPSNVPLFNDIDQLNPDIDRLDSNEIGPYSRILNPNETDDGLGELVLDGVGQMLGDDRCSSVDDLIEKMQMNSIDSTNRLTAKTLETMGILALEDQAGDIAVKPRVDDNDFTHQLSRLNKNEKWKQLAIALHCEDYIHLLEEHRNPTKALCLFAKIQKLTDDDIFEKVKALDESTEALE